MNYKPNKNKRSLNDFVNTLYGQKRTNKIQFRISSELKEHLLISLTKEEMSISNFLIALIIKEIGVPQPKIYTYMTDEELKVW